MPNDEQQASDAEIDKAYNELIARILGPDAVEADRPLRDALGEAAPGGMTVVPDASDLGHVVAVEVTDGDRSETAARALAALRRSYREIPLDPSE